MADPNIAPTPSLNGEVLVSRIAREIARNLVPIETICERYRLSDDDYQRILRSPIFQSRLQEELEIWSASTPKAIVDRIQAKAATMIEESLVEVYDLIHDKAQPMAAKISALAWATKMAGVGEVRDLGPPGVSSGTGSGINFNIFIGDKKVTFTQSAEPNTKTIEGSAVLVDKEPTA